MLKHSVDKDSASAKNRETVIRLLSLLLILVLTAWLYWPVLDYDFVMFDDDVNIYSNPNLGEITWERVKWAFTGFEYLPRVMPLAWLALMAIFEWAGMNPEAFHAFNLGVHLLNAVWVYAVAELVLRLAVQMKGETPGVRPWRLFLPWAASAAWTLHPLRSESIAWATGWVYPLATFFALASAWMALRRMEERGTKRRLLWGGAVVSYALSVLVYPVTLGFPAALLAVEWWLSKGTACKASGPEAKGWRVLLPWVRIHGVFWLIAAFVLGVNAWARVVKNRSYPPSPTMSEFTVEHRMTQALRTVPYYAVRVAWPGETTPVYNLREPGRLLSAAGVGSLLLVGAWAAWLWRCRGRGPGWAVWTFAFLGVAAPFSGFLDYPFQASDRYGYFPGVVTILGLIVAMRRVERPKWQWFAGVSAFVWITWLATAVPRQLPKWMNSNTLFTYVSQNLKSQEGRVGFALSGAVSRARRGDFSGAEEWVKRLEEDGATPESIGQVTAQIARLREVAKGPWVIPNTRGLVAPDAFLASMYADRDAKSGEMAGARFRYRQALAVYPDFHDARYNFALWLALNGRAREAKSEYDELIRRAGADFVDDVRNKLRIIILRSAEVTGDLETSEALRTR